MNLMLNNYCNLKCSYCFASCNPQDKEEISDENLKYAISFLKRSGQHQLRILGGEPTLHPKFEKIIVNGIWDDYFKSILVFSNGICLTPELTQKIISPKTSFLINLNSPEIIGQKLYEKTIENLHAMVEIYVRKGGRPQITLGLNIFEPNFNYSYILEETKKLGLDKIRYSITVPSQSGLQIGLDYYRQYIPRIMEFLDECYKNNIKTNLDCNNPPKCLYSADELRNIVLSEHNIASRNQCSPAMDIRPNLDVSRCFVFEDVIKVNIKDFNNATELTKYFYNKIDRFKFTIPTYPECTTCTFFKDKKCQGGCLSYKPIPINEKNTSVSQPA